MQMDQFRLHMLFCMAMRAALNATTDQGVTQRACLDALRVLMQSPTMSPRAQQTFEQLLSFVRKVYVYSADCVHIFTDAMK